MNLIARELRTPGHIDPLIDGREPGELVSLASIAKRLDLDIPAWVPGALSEWNGLWTHSVAAWRERVQKLTYLEDAPVLDRWVELMAAQGEVGLLVPDDIAPEEVLAFAIDQEGAWIVGAIGFGSASVGVELIDSDCIEDARTGDCVNNGCKGDCAQGLRKTPFGQAVPCCNCE